MRLLLAEDEKDLNKILTSKLTEEGYSVDSCLDGLTALEYFNTADYDGAILDVMMPGMDGVSLLKEIRNKGNKTPVLFLTARDSIEDKVKGLDIGANDYLVKPFSLAELMARVRALTRANFGEAGNVLTTQDLVVDLKAKTVKRGERDITLSQKEFALLEYLLLNKGKVLSREQIENHIWSFDYEGGTNVVDVYISYLRKKIDANSDVKLIETLRGMGYRIK